MVFDCNYGTANVPLDLLFGTFAGVQEDVRKIWAKQRAQAQAAKYGREGNTTKLHARSGRKDKIV